MEMTVERDRVFRTRHDARIQDEVFLANQIQEQTGCTRDEALTAAARIVAKDHGRPLAEDIRDFDDLPMLRSDS